MTYGFDSSAEVMQYVPERGRAWGKSIVQQTAGNAVYLAQIGMVDMAAALSRNVCPMSSVAKIMRQLWGCS